MYSLAQFECWVISTISENIRLEELFTFRDLDKLVFVYVVGTSYI